MKRDARDYLNDIIHYARLAQQFVRCVSAEEFETDFKTQFAVIRALEVIGEAARAVPVEIRERFPGVAWMQMNSLRNQLVHNYWGIDARIVFDTVEVDVPLVIDQILGIIAALESENGDANLT
ncbi:MAG: DUF86 domain-containing protein [Defluviicoccus sp.]